MNTNEKIQSNDDGNARDPSVSLLPNQALRRKYPAWNSLENLLDRFYANLAHSEHKGLYRYLLTLALSVVALFFRMVIAPENAGLQFITFFPAVAISAVLFGTGPGLFATFIGATMGTYFFFPPYEAFSFDFQRHTMISVGIFCADGLIVSLSIGAVHRYFSNYVIAVAKLETALEQSRRNEAELTYQKYALDQHAIVAVTDVRGTITYVNNPFCAISQYSGDELLGQNYRMLNAGTHPKEFFEAMYRTIACGKVWKGDICNCAKDGSLYWVSTTIVPYLDDSGKPSRYVAICADVTERKQAEAELQKRNTQLSNAEQVLRASQNQLQLALKGGDLGFWDWNVASGKFFANDRWYSMLGLHPKSAVSTRDLWRSLVHPDDISQMDHLLKTTIMNPAGADFALELRVMHSSGHYIWVLNKGAVFERTGDGHPLRVVGTHMDITEAKLAALKTQEDQKVLQENQRQLQDLSRRVLAAQETERRRVAHELHDELGQALTAIKINLLLQQRSNAQPPSRLDVENIRIVEDALQQVRTLALALRPAMLDDLGLPAALAWLAESISVNREVVVNFHCAMEHERLASEVETACFRIVQETLTNIRRHAGAKKVDIDLVCVADQLILTVTDDGVGFDPIAKNGQINPQFSLGLLGIKERALSIGGSVTFRTAPGQGCTVQLRCSLATESLSVP
jgi:PAS domain S-box-containing protein